MIKFILTVLLGVAPAFSQNAKDDVLLNAMSKELARSFEKLKNAEAAPLYYLSYEVTDSDYLNVNGRVGALEDSSAFRRRILAVDARVGSYELDNTHEMKGRGADDNSTSRDYETLPVEDDADSICASLWLATDAEYKNTLNRYAKVITNKGVTAEESDKSGDFLKRRKAEVFYEKAPALKYDRAKLETMVRQLSAIAKKYGFINESSVSLSLESRNRYFVDSEGSKIVTANQYLFFAFDLETQTEDGMTVYRYKTYTAETVDELPAVEKIASDVEAAVLELKALKNAPVAEPYNGPAILSGRAAGVFFHEIFGHRAEGHRQKSEQSGQTLAKKIGQKIMPDFISIYDDPSVREFSGKKLRGYYRFDDEGVRAGKAVLVDNGVLKGFLMSRIPIDGFTESNGHGRRSGGNMIVARQGNLIINSSKAVPESELRKMLIDEVKKSGKPYGLFVDDVGGGFTMIARNLPQSFSINVVLAKRVYVDGRPDEVVRGLNMIGTPLQTFSRIEMAGNEPEVFNGTCGAESGWVSNAIVSPGILFSEIETEKQAKSNNKPPVLKPPYADSSEDKGKK